MMYMSNPDIGDTLPKDQIFQKAGGVITRSIEALFHVRPDSLSVWIRRVWFLVLYILGLLSWSYFFNWGNIKFDLHDWTQEGFRYFFLREAVTQNKLPLHVSTTMTHLDRFIARPDTVLSPQVYLLRFFDLGDFVLVNTLILYTLGFIGLLLIQRRYSLSPVAFTVLYLIFFFNGHITDHLAVGHSMWVGYFLLSFYVLLILDLVERKRTDWTWVLLMALLLFFVFLQGAFHQFIWCLAFLLLLGIIYPRFARPAIKAIVFSLLLSAPRILPPVVEYFEQGVEFITGFLSVNDMVSSLIELKYPSEAIRQPVGFLGWWEVDHYVGLLGLGFIICFGIIFAWRMGSWERVLYGPIFAMTVLSIGYIYYFIFQLPIPLTDSERVSTRFLIIPLILLATLGSISLDKYLNQKKDRSLREYLLFLGLLLLLGHDLFQHLRIWRLVNMYDLFPLAPVDIRATISNHPDPPYISAIIVGVVLGGLSIIFLLIKVWRERKEVRR
jgi:hypothetical protein